jgi:poly-gamma-glutamate synthesis protein (capsule biosynthesis protein)
MKRLLIVFICLAILTACIPSAKFPPPTASTNSTVPFPLAVPPISEALWVNPAVPAEILITVKSWNISLTDNPVLATQKLDISDSGSVWVYALVAPFPTLTDEVDSKSLIAAWKGNSTNPVAGHTILVVESTLKAFTALWGKPASGAVEVALSGDLLDMAWKQSAWAIIPFEEIQPKWKVLSVDYQSPLHKNFEVNAYPLKMHFLLSSNAFMLPESNRESSKLTTVILTGVTALTRFTAQRMEKKGITYPGEVLRDMFREVDILHINHESPFYSGCPHPDPKQLGEIFCSSPDYIGLFTDLGVDVVELSGDHFADYGDPAMLESIAIYKKAGIPYYGGGINEDDGKKPLLMEVNSNKIMFIGCDYKTVYATARANRPGSVRCDFDYMTKAIQTYKAQGYLPIFTYQYNEFPTPEVRPQQQMDFRTMADAGAVVVSGSQAHLAQGMEFYSGAFIHYGLGNLFFDQMRSSGVRITQFEFIDRHVFYGGKYLGVELITAFLEDYSRPRYMTGAEREKFLAQYFEYSGWSVKR